jgi:small-conductance mechanosensitive channel
MTALSGRLVALLVGLLTLLPAVGVGQPAPPADLARAQAVIEAFPAGLTPAQVEALVGAMDEGAARAALKAFLAQRAASAAVVTPPAAAEAPEAPLTYYGRRVEEIAATYDEVDDQLGAAVARGGPTGSAWEFASRALLVAVIAIAAGLGVALLLHGRAPSTDAGPATRRLARLGADLAGVLAYGAGLVLLYLLIRPENPAAGVLLHALLVEGAIFGVIVGLAGLVFAPRRAADGLAGLGPEAARKAYRIVVIATGLLIVAGILARFITGMGLRWDYAVAVGLPIGSLAYLYLITQLLRHRAAIARGMAPALGGDGRARRLAAAAPIAAAGYVLVLWVIVVDAALRSVPDVGPRAMASLAIPLLVPVLARVARLGLLRVYPAAGEPETEDAAHVTRLMRAVWVVLAIAALAVTAMVWDVGTGAVGDDVLTRVLVNVGLIVLLGYVGWALIQRWIAGRLAAAATDLDPTRSQRLRTLLPLFRNFLRITLVIMIVMLILASLGIQIGPLLAGAGVIGLAIGLGAQQTIADILAGVFFLFEDAFRIGDYVEVGNIRGTVEGISIRSLKLRHQRGAVHTLPFGQIKTLTNYTRDWSLMRLEFRLPADTDLGLVKKIVKQVAKELEADPEIGPNFIEGLKSQGVRSVEDNAIVVGIKYITRPGKQWTIRREAFQRLLQAFRQHGIELVGRGVVVKVEAADVPPAVVGAAASAALEAPAKA